MRRSKRRRSLAQNQVAETDRINALYDAELARLRKLWGGAQPGSLGPLPGNAADGRGGQARADAGARQRAHARTQPGKTTLK